MTDRAGAFAAVNRAARESGSLDVVVNNAGYGLFGMIEETTAEQARAQIDTNLLGPLWVTQAASCRSCGRRAVGTSCRFVQRLAVGP